VTFMRVSAMTCTRFHTDPSIACLDNAPQKQGPPIRAGAESE